ncbi:MAG: hypothetical protein K2L84_08580 [Muribaculaceae bacterium]|nr:hypothetical protein [Muribaculaceae bacterium]
MIITSNILCIVSIAISLIIGLFDLPASMLMLFILFVSYIYATIGNRNSAKFRYSLFSIVSFVYLVSAIICSSCFSETEFFLASDPIRYIATAHNTYNYESIFNELESVYIDLSDSNGLYNSIIRYLGLVCSNNNFTASSLLLTLPQALFGILTIQTVFRILNIIVSPDKAYKYTIIYSICSLTLLYSGIIVRDIVIAFTYAVCIETVLKPFNIKGCFIIVLMLLVCIGLRLFSGFFISIFLVYYLFFNIKNAIGRFFIYIATAVILPGILASAFFNQIIDQTNNEIESYSQWQTNVSSDNDGFSSRLRMLPSGVNNVALSLFSQMNPFPPYSTLRNPHLEPAQVYMGLLMTTSAIWWFFISYSVLWLFLFKKGYKKLGIRYNILYAIAWLLIIVSCTMHVDIRRLIPVYPIIYFIFIYCTNNIYSKKTMQQIYTKLGCGYAALNLLYLLIK